MLVRIQKRENKHRIGQCLASSGEEVSKKRCVSRGKGGIIREISPQLSILDELMNEVILQELEAIDGISREKGHLMMKGLFQKCPILPISERVIKDDKNDCE